VQEMALKSQTRCGTLDDIPGISDDIKRMYQILKRMESCQSTGSGISDFDISEEEELDSDDDVPDVDLTQRLEGINLDDANAIWAQLTESERKDFEAIVQSDDVNTLIPTYSPWWENKCKAPLIEEIPHSSSATASSSSSTASIPRRITECPDIVPVITDFSQISTKPPAACVNNNLINVLAAYTSTIRFFLADHLDTPHEAASYIIAICANLKTNANFDEPTAAIDSICYEAHNEGFNSDHIDVDVIKKDVDFITEGSDPAKPSTTYILAALSDVHRLLKTAKSEKKVSADVHASAAYAKGKEFEQFVNRLGDHKIADAQTIDKAKLNSSIKKIEYYLSFVKKFR